MVGPDRAVGGAAKVRRQAGGAEELHHAVDWRQAAGARRVRSEVWVVRMRMAWRVQVG